ncbi:hypothetical protein Tcan_05861 [Toxocara canis]|uniref:Uncharacterized protein n=1 Tax=Toxocara canis TaxID=6265 RepID=A0A0B2V4C0_TOXCA|nr:hypothetical protein Tcan_05861 [Toxocara canis]
MKKVGQEEARLRMIDSEHLRAILEAQEERQHQMLKAVLETANQQQQALLEQLQKPESQRCRNDEIRIYSEPYYVLAMWCTLLRCRTHTASQ